MLKSGILNPALNCLLSRFRHTNRLVIADRGFPFWPGLETVDLSVVNDQPTVLTLLRAIIPHVVIGPVWMAAEFREHSPGRLQEYAEALGGQPIVFEPHTMFKTRVPGAVGLLRTGDSTPYANVILESA